MINLVTCLIPIIAVKVKSIYRNWLTTSIECSEVTLTFKRTQILKEFTNLEVLVAGKALVIQAIVVASRTSVRMARRQSLWLRLLWDQQTFQALTMRRLQRCRKPVSSGSARFEIISLRLEELATAPYLRLALPQRYKNLNSIGLNVTQITSLIKFARVKTMVNLMNFKLRRLTRLFTSFAKRLLSRCTKRWCRIF